MLLYITSEIFCFCSRVYFEERPSPIPPTPLATCYIIQEGGKADTHHAVGRQTLIQKAEHFLPTMCANTSRIYLDPKMMFSMCIWLHTIFKNPAKLQFLLSFLNFHKNQLC